MWTWQLEKCSDGLRRKCWGVGQVSDVPVYLDEGGASGWVWGHFFLVLLFVTPLKMYMGITSKLVNRKHPLAVC